MKRLCLFCESFVFLPYQQGYSEYTPGSPQEMYCDMKYWDQDDIDVFSHTMLLAQTCPKFKVSADAVEMGFKE
jgi:hypothetical protein